MRSPPHLLHPHLQSLPLTPELLPCSSQLQNFKRGIKRDISAYPALKDEKYYESFKRSVLVTARVHDCEEILQPTFSPRRDAYSLELFWLKNDFMYSVFNKCLLSDMGKTIVRKLLDNINAHGSGRNLQPIRPPPPRARLKSVDYTPMSPPLSWTNLRKAPLSSSFSTSMSSSDNWMKSLPLRNLCPIILD